MDEHDYIELNTLLAKLRVVCLKEIGNPEIKQTIREKDYKLVRSIDNIRRQIPLKVDEGVIIK